MVLQRTEQDKIGFIHYRFIKHIKGIPVENSMYIAHTKNRLLQNLGGAIVTDFDPLMDERNSQRVSAEQAISTAIKYGRAKV